MQQSSRHDTTGDTIERIVRLAVRDHAAWNLLARLVDDFGPRPAGSLQAEAAVRWVEKTLSASAVQAWREDVVVPHWVRGNAEAAILGSAPRAMALLALGGSVPTPDGGIEAEIAMVRSLEEIDEAGDTLDGKIVFMNREMNLDRVASQRSFEAYRDVSPLRVQGPSRAATRGGVAYLIRSLGTGKSRLPHAGHLVYRDDAPRIPAAAIAAEDAMWLERLLAREPVRVFLRLTPSTRPHVRSANVVAEVEGRDLAEEIVLIGAHLDSWDNSPGAHDNGSGVVMVMETLRILSLAGIRPRRTVRGVLFMNEENGGHGGITYHAAHRNERIVAVVETDHGAAAPIGFDTTLPDERSRALVPLMDTLESLGVLAPLAGRAARVEMHSATGVDTTPFRNDGVPGFGLMPDPRHYFDLHHTAADTLDKVDPDHLARCVAAFASLVWTLAEDGVPGS